MHLFCLHFFKYRFNIFAIILAETPYRRTPPFGAVEDTAAKHLGDYTHSHETVDKSTYSCHPIGECQVCSPLEKVKSIHHIHCYAC
jgi:hypothetical protein